MGDIRIGQLLAHSPDGQDGIWPCEAVRDILEDLGTEEMARGIQVGRFNVEAVVHRGEGDSRQRDRAKSYREWSAQVAARYPFTARILVQLGDTYESQARWHDDRFEIEKRLPN